MTLNDFRKALLDMGSDTSKWANKNVFGGVNGMPITHQIGFGSYLKQGINPNRVNIDLMNDEVHFRMVAVYVGLYGGTSLLEEKDGWAQLFGALTTGVSGYHLVKLLADWEAGFKAATMLDATYWNKRQKRPPMFLDGFTFQNKVTIKSPIKMLGNHQKPAQKRTIKIGSGSMLGNNPSW